MKSETSEPTEPVEAEPQALDELGEASFPASDPPPAWTWEIDRARAY